MGSLYELRAYKYKELNSANNRVNLEEDPEPQKDCSPSQHLYCSFVSPLAKSQLSHAQTPIPQKM